MTTRRILLLLCATALIASTGQAQTSTAAASSGKYKPTPPHKWEFGLHVGHDFLNGDFDWKPGFGVGLHLRRSLDYVFSLRADIDYASISGEPSSRRSDGIESYKTNVISGSLQGVITLNNLLWDKPQKKTNLYTFFGAGLLSTGIEQVVSGRTIDIDEQEDLGLAGIAEGGAGIAFRVSPKFNIGIEHKVGVPFGKTADFMDGYNNPGASQTTYRDILQFTNIRLNFNIGAANKTEPLYWLNPLDGILDDIAELKARPVLDLTDTDGDGVIDMLDQEKSSPKGARVDTRGVTLDSDGDGVADYMDKEPYSPPGYTVNGEGVASTPKYTTETQVQSMIDKALKDYALTEKKGAIADWFLPMVHFDNNRYDVKYAEYGKLANVAQVMKANADIKVVVAGHTDGTASETYNNVLSYNRARAAIEHLVNKYGISRDRLILNWGGEANNLVPVKGSSFMNRRVEFKVATTETEMGRPEGPDAGRGKFEGSKDSGY